jgi:hypothetical protein
MRVIWMIVSAGMRMKRMFHYLEGVGIWEIQMLHLILGVGIQEKKVFCRVRGTTN